jgi:anthraniloyl-CoA monooxygenase
VLLGDAAHTAHFSIGSGTKLAMEDAIALANAFVRHTDVDAALVDYELERQPVVERVQQAADESAAYFQRVAHHADLEPMQFAFNLLTRSGRISHASLEVRDPDFVRVLDTWMDGASRGEAGRMAVGPPPLFAPLSIGGLRVPNRIVRAASHDARGTVAHGGVGLVLTGLVAVDPDGRTSPDCPTFRADEWMSIVEGVHGAGALVMLQLGHAGRRGATQPRARGVDLPLRTGGWPLLSASPLRYGPFSAEPKAVDDDDMARVRQAFTAAASHAAIAGFDALELDMAHGFLLASFLSPLTNRRHDGYGGSLGNRLRFPLEVLDDVRAAWPNDRLLGVRLTVTDWASSGVGVDEGVEIARVLKEHGAQLIHVEAGQTVPEALPDYRRGFLTALSDRVRSEARVPTLVGGYLTTPDEVNTIVGAGRADLCLIELTETDLDRQVAL